MQPYMCMLHTWECAWMMSERNYACLRVWAGATDSGVPLRIVDLESKIFLNLQISFEN